MSRLRFLLLCSLSAFPLTVGLLAFSAGPLPRLTGGFQEATCHSCHNSFPLNEGRSQGGVFHITGIPKTYEPGQSYRVGVVIGQPGQLRFGFELSARSPRIGRQIGRLEPVDQSTQVEEEAGIQYILHTKEATERRVTDGPVEFEFDWIAPTTQESPVFFNASGNAGDFSQDPSGDYVYTAGAYTQPQTQSFAPPAAEAVRERPVHRRTESGSLINLPNPLDRDKGQFEFYIEHRFLESVEAGPGEAFGIDLGANINLGLNYSPTDRLTVGISRTRIDNILALAAALELHHNPDSFWRMDLVGGVEGESNFKKQHSTFFQLPITLEYQNFRFHLVPSLVFNSRDDELAELLEPLAVNPEDNHTFFLGIGADVALNPTFSLVGEYIPRLAGFGGYSNDNPSVGGGVAIRTWGHVFTVTATTSREFTSSRYNGSVFLPNFKKDFVLGFNIYRKF